MIVVKDIALISLQMIVLSDPFFPARTFYLLVANFSRRCTHWKPSMGAG